MQTESDRRTKGDRRPQHCNKEKGKAKRSRRIHRLGVEYVEKWVYLPGCQEALTSKSLVRVRREKKVL